MARTATEKCKETRALLPVVDTVYHFAGLERDSENDSEAALACMKPLQQAAANVWICKAPHTSCASSTEVLQLTAALPQTSPSGFDGMDHRQQHLDDGELLSAIEAAPLAVS